MDGPVGEEWLHQEYRHLHMGDLIGMMADKDIDFQGGAVDSSRERTGLPQAAKAHTGRSGLNSRLKCKREVEARLEEELGRLKVESGLYYVKVRSDVKKHFM